MANRIDPDQAALREIMLRFICSSTRVTAQRLRKRISDLKDMTINAKNGKFHLKFRLLTKFY